MSEKRQQQIEALEEALDFTDKLDLLRKEYELPEDKLLELARRLKTVFGFIPTSYDTFSSIDAQFHFSFLEKLENEGKLTDDEVWQRVLEKITAPMTQALLNQHGQLMAFDGSVALIGINKKKFLEIIRDRLYCIEIAFKSVCKKDIKVKLDLLPQLEAESIIRGRPDVSKFDSEDDIPF
ncbi:MAG: hypothetical protein AB4426_11600 [Xenococcaceae cyanobacterium]